VQQDLDVQFVLNLAPQGAACVLGGASASRLGWTSWVAGAHGSTSPNGPVRAPAPVLLTLRAAAAPVRHH
jgi:type VI secretion system protein ImpH